MANLTEVLERLKAEPEWGTNGDFIARHMHRYNIARARLLDVVEALEEVIEILPDTGTVYDDLAAKLSAALEKK